MRLEVWNNDVNGFHDLLGTVETSMSDLLSLCKGGPVNYSLQTKNTDPKAVVGPTAPLVEKQRVTKLKNGTILRVMVRLPTSGGKAAAAATTEASSPTAVHQNTKAREARQHARLHRDGTSGPTRRKKKPHAYPEDLAFLRALMKVSSHLLSDSCAVCRWHVCATSPPLTMWHMCIWPVGRSRRRERYESDRRGWNTLPVRTS